MVGFGWERKQCGDVRNACDTMSLWYAVCIINGTNTTRNGEPFIPVARREAVPAYYSSISVGEARTGLRAQGFPVRSGAHAPALLHYVICNSTQRITFHFVHCQHRHYQHYCYAIAVAAYFFSFSVFWYSLRKATEVGSHFKYFFFATLIPKSFSFGGSFKISAILFIYFNEVWITFIPTN